MEGFADNPRHGNVKLRGALEIAARVGHQMLIPASKPRALAFVPQGPIGNTFGPNVRYFGSDVDVIAFELVKELRDNLVPKGGVNVFERVFSPLLHGELVVIQITHDSPKRPEQGRELLTGG